MDHFTLWDGECDRAFTAHGRALKANLEGDRSRANSFAGIAFREKARAEDAECDHQERMGLLFEAIAYLHNTSVILLMLRRPR